MKASVINSVYFGPKLSYEQTSYAGPTYNLFLSKILYNDTIWLMSFIIIFHPEAIVAWKQSESYHIIIRYFYLDLRIYKNSKPKTDFRQ